mmetsp:Transcript_9525/g.30142  ORF Transcript_9525/g.30142 Transcript_9525/m.30142 type:complete len:385 (-) Transcript_9525:126-1280(-)
MLGTFLVGCARANISNAVVVALDDATAQFARGKGAHTYVRKLVARGGERTESRPRASADRDWSRLRPRLDRQPRNVWAQVRHLARVPLGGVLGAPLRRRRAVDAEPFHAALPLPRRGRGGDDGRLGRRHRVRVRVGLAHTQPPARRAQLWPLLRPRDRRGGADDGAAQGADAARGGVGPDRVQRGDVVGGAAAGAGARHRRARDELPLPHEQQDLLPVHARGRPAPRAPPPRLAAHQLPPREAAAHGGRLCALPRRRAGRRPRQRPRAAHQARRAGRDPRLALGGRPQGGQVVPRGAARQRRARQRARRQAGRRGRHGHLVGHQRPPLPRGRRARHALGERLVGNAEEAGRGARGPPLRRLYRPAARCRPARRRLAEADLDAVR